MKKHQNDNNIEIFIHPISEHEVTAVGFADNIEKNAAFTIKDYDSVYNNSPIFRIGDAVKVIYEVEKRKEVKVFITSGYQDATFFEKIQLYLIKLLTI